MKRLQVLFLAALSSSLLLFGCGKKDAETTSNPVIEMQPQTQPSTQDADPGQRCGKRDRGRGYGNSPAEGMVRSRLTNEWVDEEIAKTRP